MLVEHAPQEDLMLKRIFLKAECYAVARRAMPNKEVVIRRRRYNQFRLHASSFPQVATLGHPRGSQTAPVTTPAPV